MTYVCPPQDNLGFRVAQQDYVLSDTSFICSYPAIPGRATDFFCTYANSNGKVILDNNAGMLAVGSPHVAL